MLRGLAGRAPYFHDGSAATLLDVVEFYNARFQIRLAPREKADLVAFLSRLEAGAAGVTGSRIETGVAPAPGAGRA